MNRENGQKSSNWTIAVLRQICDIFNRFHVIPKRGLLLHLLKRDILILFLQDSF